MAKRNVKIPKAAVTKMAKAYAQLLQRRREEEAILALGPSLETLAQSKGKKRTRRRIPVDTLPKDRRYPKRRYYESTFIGPMNRNDVRNLPSPRVRASKREREDVMDEETSF